MISNPDQTSTSPAAVDDLDLDDKSITNAQLIQLHNRTLLRARIRALEALEDLCDPNPPPTIPKPDPHAGLPPSERHAASLRDVKPVKAADQANRNLVHKERSIRLRAAATLLRQKLIAEPPAKSASTPSPTAPASAPASKQPNGKHTVTSHPQIARARDHRAAGGTNSS